MPPVPKERVLFHSPMPLYFITCWTMFGGDCAHVTALLLIVIYLFRRRWAATNIFRSRQEKQLLAPDHWPPTPGGSVIRNHKKKNFCFWKMPQSASYFEHGRCDFSETGHHLLFIIFVFLSAMVCWYENSEKWCVVVTFFDWDDTCFPSTFLANKGFRLDTPSEKLGTLVEPLRQFENSVAQVLNLALSVGEVVIVTNAERGWVELSAAVRECFFVVFVVVVWKFMFLLFRNICRVYCRCWILGSRLFPLGRLLRILSLAIPINGSFVHSNNL